jgi:hypothetical protein
LVRTGFSSFLARSGGASFRQRASISSSVQRGSRGGVLQVTPLRRKSSTTSAAVSASADGAVISTA